MAGYRVTFDGSNVDRKDVPQATSSSSLTETVQVYPAQYEYNGSGNNFGNLNLAQAYRSGANLTTLLPAGVWNGPLSFVSNNQYGQINTNGGGVGTTFQESGGLLSTFTAGTSIQFQFLALMAPASLAGQSVTIEYALDAGTTGYIGNIDGAGNTTQIFSGSGTQSHTFTVGAYGAVFWFDGDPVFGNWTWFGNMNYLRSYYFSNGPVTIVDSTQTPGVLPAGATAVVESVSTDTQGGGSVGPAKEFGIVAKHDGNDVSDTSYLPSAENIEDAKVSASTSKVITATATDVTFEAYGLGGAERLAAGETKVIVEDIGTTTEN